MNTPTPYCTCAELGMTNTLEPSSSHCMSCGDNVNVNACCLPYGTSGCSQSSDCCFDDIECDGGVCCSPLGNSCGGTYGSARCCDSSASCYGSRCCKQLGESCDSLKGKASAILEFVLGRESERQDWRECEHRYCCARILAAT